MCLMLAFSASLQIILGLMHGCVISHLSLHYSPEQQDFSLLTCKHLAAMTCVKLLATLQQAPHRHAQESYGYVAGGLDWHAHAA